MSAMYFYWEFFLSRMKNQTLLRIAAPLDAGLLDRKAVMFQRKQNIFCSPPEKLEARCKAGRESGVQCIYLFVCKNLTML